MAQNNDFKSAGVRAREIDLTGPTAIEAIGVPATCIAPTVHGPAFVPVVVPTINDYIVQFGTTSDDIKNGPLAASEWLKTQQSLVVVRPLGAGDTTARTTSGNNKGRVNNAGFVVGDQQPQTALTGALSTNVSATNGGPLGRTYFLGAFMSQSTNSTIFTEAGLSGTAPVVRGILLAASGVILTLSTSNTASNAPSKTTAAAYDATLRGAITGAVNLSSGKQEFVMLLNGHKVLESQYSNVITASFDMTAPNYFGNLLNKDPLKLEQAGYVLYSQYDIHPSLAALTGTGMIQAASGAGGLGAGYERIAFLLTGSQTRNLGSATVPNYENFEDRYRAPSSPWVISQRFGGSPTNLFKVYSLDDGSYANTKVKLSVENITPSNTDTTRFGVFDLLVRDFNDTDANKVVLEAWRNLSLNPKSPRYIAKIIGDMNTFLNFDASQSTSQKLIVDGEYPNKSKYIRVSLSDDVKDGAVDPTALPMGFRGVQHLITSGTAPMPAYTDTLNLSTTNPFYRLVQPPVPMRINLTKGPSTNQVVDKSLYWGVQFEQQISVSESNASNVLNKSIASYTKYYPNFQTDYINFSVRDNDGTADSAANGVVDADRFCNNMFSLEKIQVKYNASSLIADVSLINNWTYVRAGGIAQSVANLTRALQVSDLLEPSVRNVAKFTFCIEGGFDGTRIFNRDCVYLTNNAVYEEMNSSTRGLSTSGPTVKSYLKCIDIIKDSSEVSMQLLAIPGIRHRYITDTATAAVQSSDRFDSFYIMDIEERDNLNNAVRSDSQVISVKNTVSDFRGRGVNSDFTGAFFPDVNMIDPFNRSNVVRVPPSVVALGAFGKNDAIAYPWHAPAGFARGSLDSVKDIVVRLSRQNMDDLQSVNINPLVSFPGQGPVIWGQKTLKASASPLERINVRRMLISVRRDVRKIANRMLFEQNRETTLERFAALVRPILKKVKDTNGISAYQVKIDTSTTTEIDVENKTIRGQIFLVPINALETLSLDFVLTNQLVSI